MSKKSQKFEPKRAVALCHIDLRSQIKNCAGSELEIVVSKGRDDENIVIVSVLQKK